jgi:hypothetical protein
MTAFATFDFCKAALNKPNISSFAMKFKGKTRDISPECKNASWK